MEIVTGFDSGFSEEKKPGHQPVEEYDRILTALGHNHEVAENVFARIAKEQFHAQVDHNVKRIRLDELLPTDRQGFIEFCVTFSLDELTSFNKNVMGGVMVDHLKKFGDYVLSVAADDLALVDSLNIRIIRMDDAYQFRFKQKWANRG